MEPPEQRAGGDGKYIPIIAALIGLVGTVLVGYWQSHPRPEPSPSPQPTQAAAPTSTAPEPTQVAKPAQAAEEAEVSREFFVGRWQVEQTIGQVSGTTVIDYEEDGTFSGWMSQFANGVGQKVPVAGRWNYERLSKDRFRLYIQFPDGSAQQATFKIQDRNHILNTDQNYVAVRLE
jgi:hypothetical protein